MHDVVSDKYWALSLESVKFGEYEAISP